jgi:riboflavin transporter FmnP
MNKSVSIKKLSVAGMLCALAYLCMFIFRIKVSFLTFDAKDAILAILSLLYGPVWGVASSAVVALLEFLTVSDTGVYGLIMNFLSSATFTGVCGLIYKYKRNFSGAVVGVIAATLSLTGVMMIANLLITPYYMGVSRADVVGLIPVLLLPFNLTKSILNAALTMAVYKLFTTALKQTGLLTKNQEKSYTLSKKTVMILVSSLAVVALSVVVFLVFMKGNFELLPKNQ